MSSVVLAVCDKDALYCERLSEYLRSNLKLSFEIQAFTEEEKLTKYLSDGEISLFIVSESTLKDLDKEMLCEKCSNIMILDEEEKEDVLEGLSDIKVQRVSKYLPAAEIVDKILEFCTSGAEGFSGLSCSASASDCKVFGFYTPLSRCGQTSFAIKMGEALAKKSRTVLISFESFSALTSLFEQEADEDIMDLLYFADCEREKFCVYLERIKRTRKGLDIIAPPKTAMQTKEISFEQVKELVKLLSTEAGYENILFDLKDYPDGFFDILNMCDVVYTIVRNNSADHYRMGRYNKVLSENDCEQIIAKTVKCILPDGRDLHAYNGYVEEMVRQCREVKELGA